MKLPTLDIILASCKDQGFKLGSTGYWWVEDERKLATPLGILARHAGVLLPNPCGATDPVWAWCTKQWGHHVTEAVMRGFEGHPQREGMFCCFTDRMTEEYNQGWHLGREARDVSTARSPYAA